MQPFFADSGVFIALEGGEGGGKSTQSALLVEWLESLGRTVVLTREPGGTAVGARLRSIVLGHETGDLSPRTEALLYAADKAEHVDSVVLPALEAGHVVITDRYVDSTLAYQGAGRALPVEEIEHVARWATRSLRPHLTVLLDVDPEVGLTRFEGADRIEAEPLEFHRRVREGFLGLAAADPTHYLVVPPGGGPADVHAAIRPAVEPWLEQRR